LYGPDNIAFDSAGSLYVADTDHWSCGKVLGRSGGEEANFEDLGHLGHLAVDASGYILVSEAAPNTIQKFAPSGKRVGVGATVKRSGSDQWGGPKTIIVCGDGAFMVKDWRNHRIVALSPSGQTLFSFAGAGEVAGRFSASSLFRIRERLRWSPRQGSAPDGLTF
jgi:tripartite motif-containing protein 71